MSKIVVCNNCGHIWRTKAKRPQCNECKKVSVREATDQEKHQYNHPEAEAPQVEESTPEAQPFEDNGELFQPLPPGEVEEVNPQIILSPELNPQDPQEITPEPQDKPQGVSWTKPLIVVIVGACVVLAGLYYVKGRQTKTPETPEDPSPENCIGGYSTPGAFI